MQRVYRIIIAALILAVAPTHAPAASAPPPGYSSSEIHVKFRQGTRVDSPDLLLPPDLANSVESISRLFGGIPKEKLDKMKESGEGRSQKRLPDLNLWFKIKLKQEADPSDFIEKLKRLGDVEHAEFAPLPAPSPAITPDFEGNQGYLEIAPGGIDALFSSTIPGGNGSGIKIYDVEYSWNQNHEDLSKASGILLLLDAGDSAVDPFNDNNHGTAVLGELIADNDTKGVTGISWGAEVGLAPANTALRGYNPAHAILLAVADGEAGDIILIEQQAFVCGLPSFGPSESVSSVFDAIQTAVANGFVVVEAAGNGSINLDQAACGTTFDRTVRDSGAIIVGAGKPPSSGADRERESFSTYGSRVDLQGWGRSVMTTGYGVFYTDPSDPTNPNRWYTAFFDGTSSASPIVAGATANLQGIALAHFGTPLDPSEIRTLLVATGSAQLGNTSEHIGPRPDLFRAISELLGVVAVAVTVDIKPRDFPNSINPKSKGLIPVAILTTNTFDATVVDPNTVRFGKNGTEAQLVHFALADADGDGDRDLILQFRTEDSGLQCGDTLASVRGRTFSGAAIEGSDSVRTVGCGLN
jgi:serine protease